ncbi:hypothetical protein DL89DRAFT_92637 [Linderina pennispora]|uniref:Cell morphogenesis central region domain-containing protein n=1 Tax=Linderina pennispora TaxID=61395 RepID=A0A1Y1VX00_9FUNG|nr:uncharacterized protein DL89DRAFT_92637 [Linderina pennispora]ORX65828.1 hypothetical protein DL89DRAFT_92637 [Linderina pennispora]
MLRQHTVHALCHTPAAHLQELMRELRPLADALFDDGSAAVHRNYLHVAAGSAGLAIKSNSPAAQPPMLPTSSNDDLASDASSVPSSRRAGSFDAAAKDDPTAAGSTSVQRRKRLRHSLAQLYKHVARQLAARDTSGRALFQDDLVISQLIAYVRETRTFLTDANAVSEPEHQGLRMQFCGLVEALYYFLSEPATQPLLPKAARRFTHETRRGLYQLCERWCGPDPSKDDRLRRAALRSLAVLCRGAPANTSEGGPRDQPALLAWVAEALADRSLQSIAQHAISWTVLADPAGVEMLRALVQLAYGDGRVALGCLAALTSVLASDTLLPECQPWLLVLLLVHVQADQRMLRRQALLLLQTLRQDPHMTAALAPAILADVPVVARRAACQLAENVAGAFPEMSAQICAEVAHQVSELPEPRLACLLRILRPWLANVQLAASEPPPSMAPGTAISEDSQHVLQCLLLITTRAGAAHIDAMQDAWAAVVESPTHGQCNQRVVVQFLVTLLLCLRSSALLVLVRRVCVFLARSTHRTQLLDQLISETCRPSAFVPLPHIPEDHSLWAEELRAAMGHGETVQIATGALALYCLNAIALELPLPLLRVLPPALFAIAYPEPWVRVSARALIRTLVAQQPGDPKPLLAILRSPACLSGFGHLDKKDSTDLLDTLPSDLLPRAGEPPNDQSRITLQTLVAGLSQSISSPEFAQSLATDAVNWAMGCPVRHMAALSLQIFSSLAIEAQHGSVVVTPTRNMVLRLIDRLSNVLENEPELSVFAETVLHALRQVAILVVRNADVEIVSDLMATAISVMQVAGSGVYAAALGVFERVFPLVTDHDNIRAKIRAKAGLNVSGYQPALLHGLKFSACRERCLRLLREEPCMDIAILSVAAHLPSMLEPSWDETPADRHAPVTSLFDKYHSFVQRALTGTTADESRKFLSLLLSHLSSPTNSNNLVRQFGYCASDHSPSDFLSVLLDLCSPSMRARTALKHLSALQFASLQSTPLLGEIRRIAISLDLFASVLSCSQVATLAVDLRLLVQLNVMAGIIAKRAERALLLVLQRARERIGDADGLDVARQALARIVAMGVDDEHLGCDDIVGSESGDEDLLRDLDDFDRMLDEALLQ